MLNNYICCDNNNNNNVVLCNAVNGGNIQSVHSFPALTVDMPCLQFSTSHEGNNISESMYKTVNQNTNYNVSFSPISHILSVKDGTGTHTATCDNIQGSLIERAKV